MTANLQIKMVYLGSDAIRPLKFTVFPYSDEAVSTFST